MIREIKLRGGDKSSKRAAGSYRVARKACFALGPFWALYPLQVVAAEQVNCQKENRVKRQLFITPTPGTH